MAKTKAKSVHSPLITSHAVFLVLLLGLLLSGYNLALMIRRAGELSGLSVSWETLRANYGARIEPLSDSPGFGMQKSDAPVLWSVVKFRDGEQVELQNKLVDPLLAGYASAPTPLRAVLVERKNAASRVVNVRLFLADGSEQAYLWPTTHSDDNGMWVSE